MKPKDLVGAPDQVDQQKLNEEIWNATKGPNVPMPAPQQHVFGTTCGNDKSLIANRSGSRELPGNLKIY